MRRLVQSSASEVVTECTHDRFAEIALLVLREVTREAGVIGDRPTTYVFDQRDECGTKLGKKRTHHAYGHAVFREVEQRVVGLRVSRRKRGQFATHLSRDFLQW